MKKDTLNNIFHEVLIASIIAGLVLVPASTLQAQKEVRQLDNDLTIVLGGGGNSGVLVTPEAVVVIDTKLGKDAEDLYVMAKQKAVDKPIIVINTHYHPDHTKGNHLYEGSKIITGEIDRALLLKAVGEENMPNAFVRDTLTIDLGSETLLLFNMGQAHTYSDLVVFLKKKKILFTGDLVFHDINPVLKKESGADVDKWITVLGKLLTGYEAGTVIPGHGSIGGMELIGSMKQYLEDMRTAAINPGQETIMIGKYKEWRQIPNMTSPEITIAYIRKK
jgi:cyclase